jgi:hypothetical protein
VKTRDELGVVNVVVLVCVEVKSHVTELDLDGMRSDSESSFLRQNPEDYVV